MTITINDTSARPLLMTDGQSLAAYKGVTVADTGGLSSTETVTISLAQTLDPAVGAGFYFYPVVADYGTISDPNGGGTFDAATETFTESGLVGGDPTFASNLLSRLLYHAPHLPDGSGFATQASIAVKNGLTVTDIKPVIVGVVSPPAISGTVADEPIASGNSIRPFATVSVSNGYFGDEYYTTTASYPYPITTYQSSDSYSAKDTLAIVITDNGKPTDADGLLTGAGLSKTGVGMYSLATAQYYYNIGYTLNNLTFQTNTLAAGQTLHPHFELDVTDSASALISKDTITSLLVIGPALVPVVPLIAGTLAGQTVVAGNVLDPFASVTLSDSNPTPTDSGMITITDASGKASDASGTLTGKGLTETAVGSGIYTLAATDPKTLTTELDSLTFHPIGTSAVTTGFTLAVTDPAFATPATDSKTTVTETIALPPVAPSDPNGPPPAPSPVPVLSDPNALPPVQTNGNFQVQDETSGKAYFSDGESYTGPVAGLTNEIILATSDNTNVTAHVKNVFIKTGGGEDAIDVSAINGNNVMDGSTGSNFLTGGTGNDTFFLDDRNAAATIWSTMVKFHSGDTATVFGVTQAGFDLSWVDGMGAVGAKGLTGTLTAAGQPTAMITLAGFKVADLTNGTLSISYGKTGDLPNLLGSNYMQIRGN